MTEDQAAAAASEETAKPADGFDIDPSTITLSLIHI